ncbi:MAG: penicillin-binding protein 2 [Acidimicrobiales bacterium]
MNALVRMRMFAFASLVLFGALGARLWYLQGVESMRAEFQEQALTNVLEPVYEEAPRGRILDRNGRVIVDNKVVQVVTIDRAVMEDLEPTEREAMFLRLAIAVSRSGRLVKVEDMVDEFDDKSFGPYERIPVAVDVNPELLVFLGERPDEFPGVEIVKRTARSYPYGSLAAHLLGYVGPINRTEWEQKQAQIDPEADGAKTYQLNHEIGKTGIERIFESELRGVPGTRWLEINASLRVVGEVEERYEPPIPGNDVWLSIDLDLQMLAEQELANGLRSARQRGADEGDPPSVAPAGSVVMIDPRNGDLVAMASFPTYEPADFVQGITATQFRELTSEDNYSPILNRAIQGTYAPGSTFKLVTALAALQEGVLGDGADALRSPDALYNDQGSYTYSRCFEESSTCRFSSPFSGSRWVDLRGALRVSSDTYFYEIAGEGFWLRPQEPDADGYLQDEGIQKWARALGLGIGSGIQLPYERSGAVPDRAYYDRQYEAGVFAIDGSQWFAGATVNLSIGQGELLVTPLQLANLYATFGNGGRVHQPNVAIKITDAEGELVRRFSPRVLRDLQLPAEFIEPIENGLIGVTLRQGGTATRSFINANPVFGQWPVAGKTGTAEVKSNTSQKADTSLFAAYAPVYWPGSAMDPDAEPEFAIAVVMEESGFGSASAAPVTAAILEAIATDSVPVARSLDETARYALGLVDNPGEAASP